MALLQFLITPIILWKLGVAGYALVAFFATFMAFLAVLDLGLSATLTRKIARRESPGAAVLLQLGAELQGEDVRARVLHAEPLDAHTPMLMTHFGSIIWSYTWRRTGAIF